MQEIESLKIERSAGVMKYFVHVSQIHLNCLHDRVKFIIGVMVRNLRGNILERLLQTHIVL